MCIETGYRDDLEMGKMVKVQKGTENTISKCQLMVYVATLYLDQL
jgi:hypothetical protein